MFNLQQIKDFHSIVKSWADFPQFIDNIKSIWVVGYDVFVVDWHATYFGLDGFSIHSEARYDNVSLSEKADNNYLPWWISGKPTQEKSDYLIGKTYQTFGKQIIIVWVGGIFSAEDAYYKIKQWASLVELITGMIFQWPQLIWAINQWLVGLLRKDWYTNISEAIGKNF